jgi:formate dehydrogenase subunit delta
MSGNKLVGMANQIAAFFAAYPEESAVASTSDHLRKFWDPVMRRQIRAHLEAGGEGLSPIARKAVEALAA